MFKYSITKLFEYFYGYIQLGISKKERVYAIRKALYLNVYL